MIGARSYKYSGYPAKPYLCAKFLAPKDASNITNKSLSKPNLKYLSLVLGNQRMQQNIAIVLRST